MSSRKTNVPSIPEVTQTAESIDRTLRALKEATEVGYGRRGDKLDRFVTVRDLRDGNVVTVDNASGKVLGPVGAPGTGAPLPDDTTLPDFGDDDYTTPPMPRNVKVKGLPPDIAIVQKPGQGETAESLGIMMVTWDQPDYHNHFYSEIYRIPMTGAQAPTLNLEDCGMLPAYPHGFVFQDGSINQITEQIGAVFAGTAEGTIFVDKDLPTIASGGDALDQALNPGTYYYWVRFVSRALVPGPQSEPPGFDKLSINPTLVLDLMTQNITQTAIFRHLREWLALGDPAVNQGSILDYIDTAISESSISSLWSVRMRHDTSTGLTFTSGFGMGMETTQDGNGKWSSLSTFLVNANQFAIMGPNTFGGGARILSWSGGGKTLTLGLATGAHGFVVTPGDEPNQRAVLMIPDAAAINSDNPSIANMPTWLSAYAGMEVEVVSVSGSQVTVTSDIDLRSPQNEGYPGFNQSTSVSAEWGLALMPGQNIPFIVDATRQVVGIRGSLIVDGLVRGIEGEFNELTANTAFINRLQAEVVNANVVIGQRIIAGTPGTGAISNEAVANISNYIVELNNPSKYTDPETGYPIQIYKPSGHPSGPNHRVFSVNALGDLYMGGNLTVGGAGVIQGQTEGAGPDTVIFSTGGKGASGNPTYPLWIGTKGNYGTNGGGRTENNGIISVRSDGKVYFNADLFLNGDPLALPSGNGYITVKPKAQGGAARVFCSAGFSIIGPAAGAGCWTGAALFLAPDGPHSLGGAYPIGRGGIGFQSPDDDSEGGVNRFVSFLTDIQDWPSQVPGSWKLVAATQIDFNKDVADVKSSSLQGSVTVPAGNYRVHLVLWPKGGNNRVQHGCFAVSPFAVQVSNNAAPSQYRPTGLPGPARELPMPLPDDFVVAGEDILKGAFVNIYEDGGFAYIRQADASIPYRADGYIIQSAAEGDRVQVYRDGINPYLEGLTPGAEYALGTEGAVISLASAAGSIIQPLGKALTDTSMQVEIDEPVGRS